MSLLVRVCSRSRCVSLSRSSAVGSSISSGSSPWRLYSRWHFQSLSSFFQLAYAMLRLYRRFSRIFCLCLGLPSCTFFRVRRAWFLRFRGEANGFQFCFFG